MARLGESAAMILLKTFSVPLAWFFFTSFPIFVDLVLKIASYSSLMFYLYCLTNLYFKKFIWKFQFIDFVFKVVRLHRIFLFDFLNCSFQVDFSSVFLSLSWIPLSCPRLTFVFPLTICIFLKFIQKFICAFLKSCN